MFKRVTWFVSGLAAGAAGAGYAKKKVKATADAMKPVNVAKSALGRVRGSGRHVADAVREGRQAMKDKEAELWALRDEGGSVERSGAAGPVDFDRIIEVEEVRRGGQRSQSPRTQAPRDQSHGRRVIRHKHGGDTSRRDI